jgi:HEAT repeat protein
MLEELVRAGIDVSDFGRFGSLYPSAFDFNRATPILIDWLPRIDEPAVVESIARSLAGQRAARGEGAGRLIDAFRRTPNDSARWAIGNTLSTIAGPQDADDLIDLLQDSQYRSARQMLCAALAKTRDPRVATVLIDLIDDDVVNGHAVLELRRLGRWKGLPLAERPRPKLEQLVERPGAGEFAKKHARAALASLTHTQ